MFDLIGPAAGETVLAAMLQGHFAGKVALVSSFGTESAILLHMISQIDRSVPVILLDTGKLFAETLAYRDRLVGDLGLRDVRSIHPSDDQLRAYDPEGLLWQRDPDLCCAIRKTGPLDAALAAFEVWITGRKRTQGKTRAKLNLIDTGPDGRITLNPLAYWEDEQVESYFRDHDLPRHPLQAQGYASIGCATCTQKIAAGEAKRAGRWAGLGKTECGIHLPRRTRA